MGYRDGHYCCYCDLCSAGVCVGGAYTLFLTDSKAWEHTLFCIAHAPIVVEKMRAYLVAHPGVTVDPDCTEAWEAAQA